MSARGVLADAMNMPRYWPDDVRFKRPDAYLAALFAAGYAVVPREPTEAMHNAARDWSLRKYGQGIGKEASDGCYRAMIAASEPQP